MRLNGPYAFFYLFLGLGLVGREAIKLKMKRRVLGVLLHHTPSRPLTRRDRRFGLALWSR